MQWPGNSYYVVQMQDTDPGSLGYYEMTSIGSRYVLDGSDCRQEYQLHCRAYPNYHVRIARCIELPESGGKERALEVVAYREGIRR